MPFNKQPIKNTEAWVLKNFSEVGVYCLMVSMIVLLFFMTYRVFFPPLLRISTENMTMPIVKKIKIKNGVWILCAFVSFTNHETSYLLSLSSSILSHLKLFYLMLMTFCLISSYKWIFSRLHITLQVHYILPHVLILRHFVQLTS